MTYVSIQIIILFAIILYGVNPAYDAGYHKGLAAEEKFYLHVTKDNGQYWSNGYASCMMDKVEVKCAPKVK